MIIFSGALCYTLCDFWFDIGDGSPPSCLDVPFLLVEQSMNVAESLTPLVSNADTCSPLPVSSKIIDIVRRGGLYALGESYMRGEWETADLPELMRLLVTGDSRVPVVLNKISPRFIAYFIKDRLWNAQVGRGAFEVAERHYDLGNDLFSRKAR
jgi:hypothetical protein